MFYKLLDFIYNTFYNYIMSSVNTQISFLKNANDWLSNFNNQKKFAIDDSDTNPHSSKLCLYILGGWAISRHSFVRKTTDVDLVTDQKLLDELLKALHLQGKYQDIGSPDSNELFTQKKSLKDIELQSSFSIEARFFQNSEIDFGNFKIDRTWLFSDAVDFYERIIGTLQHIKVPSIRKCIILKVFSAIGRYKKEEDKIIADLLDIHILSLNPSFLQSEKSFIQTELTNLNFGNSYSVFKNRLEQNISKLQAKAENGITEISLLYYIANLYNESKSNTNIISNIPPQSYLQNTLSSELPTVGIIFEQKDIFYQIINILQNANKNIFIFLDPDIESVFLDFIMVLVAKKIYDTNIEIIYFDNPDKLINKNEKRNYTRIRLFKQFGFKVKKATPNYNIKYFTGLIVDPNSNDVKLLTLNKGLGNAVSFFSEALYLDSSQKEIINFSFNSLRKEYFTEVDFVQTNEKIRIVELGQQEYIPYLLNVKFYLPHKSTDIKFKLYKKSDLSKIRTKQRGIKEFKHLQHEFVYSILNLQKDKIYGIELLNKVIHVVNIPIVEVSKNNHFLIEGHTRLFNLLNSTNETDTVLVAEVKGLVDDKAYLEYIHNFIDIKLNEQNTNHKKSQFSRDIEKFSHIEYYMKFDDLNRNVSLTNFPLKEDFDKYEDK